MSTVKVVTGEVRLSYCNLFTPRSSQEGEDEKYSVSVIISKKDKATIAAFEKAVQECIALNKDAKFNGKTKGLKTPLRDGDEDREGVPEYENSVFFNCSSKNAPILLDENNAPILDTRELYSGCYARVSVNLFAFSMNGNKGIAAGLNAVKKTRDGEPLGGTYTEQDAASDFGDDLL